MDPLYPDVTVQLTGQDGNAFFIISRTRSALRDAGVPNDKIAEFSEEAMSGDYNHVLQTVMAYVNVE